MFGYETFNVNYYIMSQIFYEKMGDGHFESLNVPNSLPGH